MGLVVHLADGSIARYVEGDFETAEVDSVWPSGQRFPTWFKDVVVAIECEVLANGDLAVCVVRARSEAAGIRKYSSDGDLLYCSEWEAVGRPKRQEVARIRSSAWTRFEQVTATNQANESGRVPADPVGALEADWINWTDFCADRLTRMVFGEYLVLSPKDHDERFVQVARIDWNGGDGLLVETQGSVEDGGSGTLSTDTQQLLLDLGWHPPGSYPDRSPNFQVMWGSRVTDHERRREVDPWFDPDDAADVAQLMQGTLRRVLGAFHPDDVVVLRGAFEWADDDT